jgi:hypothetical protein
MSFAESFDLDTEIVELTPFVPADQPVGDHMPLRELAFRADAWLPRETEALRTAFLADQALEDIAATLGHSRASIATRIGDLGLRRHSTRAWSEWDDAELAQRYAAEPTATIAAHLGRSVSAVYARASCLGLTEPPPQPYSGWEDAQIRVGYTHGVPVVQIAGLIGRPVMGVVCRAGHLGLRHACQPSDWSEAELARAMELASEGMRYVVIAGKLAEEGFPSRNSRSLGQRLRKFGYGRGWGRAWIAEEDDLLRRAYATGASLTPLRERQAVRSPRSDGASANWGCGACMSVATVSGRGRCGARKTMSACVATMAGCPAVRSQPHWAGACVPCSFMPIASGWCMASSALSAPMRIRLSAMPGRMASR